MHPRMNTSTTQQILLSFPNSYCSLAPSLPNVFLSHSFFFLFGDPTHASSQATFPSSFHLQHTSRMASSSHFRFSFNPPLFFLFFFILVALFCCWEEWVQASVFIVAKSLAVTVSSVSGTQTRTDTYMWEHVLVYRTACLNFLGPHAYSCSWNAPL